MKTNLIFGFFLGMIFANSNNSYCQNSFVSFETTNKSNKICQGKTLGVIATLNPEYESIKIIKWAGDSENFREYKNEIAIVNSSKAGEKKLKFSLIISENQQLDTTFSVIVLPNPDVILTFSNSSLSVDNKNEEKLVSFKWKFNGELLSDTDDMIIKNPSKGSYQVFVMDINGCRGTSQIVNIE